MKKNKNRDKNRIGDYDIRDIVKMLQDIDGFLAWLFGDKYYDISLDLSNKRLEQEYKEWKRREKENIL